MSREIENEIFISAFKLLNGGQKLPSKDEILKYSPTCKLKTFSNTSLDTIDEFLVISLKVSALKPIGKL